MISLKAYPDRGLLTCSSLPSSHHFVRPLSVTPPRYGADSVIADPSVPPVCIVLCPNAGLSLYTCTYFQSQPLIPQPLRVHSQSNSPSFFPLAFFFFFLNRSSDQSRSSRSSNTSSAQYRLVNTPSTSFTFAAPSPPPPVTLSPPRYGAPVFLPTGHAQAEFNPRMSNSSLELDYVTNEPSSAGYESV